MILFGDIQVILVWKSLVKRLNLGTSVHVMDEVSIKYQTQPFGDFFHMPL